MSKIKQKTERDLWLKIARAFERYSKTGGWSPIAFDGLCCAVARVTDEKPFLRFYLTAKDRLALHRHTAFADTLPTYFWPVDRKHAKHRAKLARQFALDCKKEHEKGQP